jgi:putative cell wall-binding protein
LVARRTLGVVGVVVATAMIGLPATAQPAPTVLEGTHAPDAVDFSCPATSWVAGTSVLCDGTLTYRDYVYDDYGADSGSLPRSQSTGTLNHTAGDDRYPEGAPPNTADLVKLSLRIDGDELEVLFELNALYEPDSTIAALAIDTDEAATGGGEWPDLGVSSDGWDVLAVFTQGDPATNLIAGRVPLPTGEHWRLQAVTAVAGGPVMNVAFRGIDEEAGYTMAEFFGGPLEDTSKGSWFEDRQAAALAKGDISEFGLSIDVADLRGGATRELTEVGPGFRQRVYTSDVTLPPSEGMSYTPIPGRGTGGTVSAFAQSFHFFGRYQPYGIYLPDAPGSHGLQMNYHGSNQGLNAQTNQPGFQEQIGEAHDRIIATPLARGPHGYGSDISERDILDVQADVIAAYDIDLDRVYVSGYSQGGYITFRQAALYPHLYAAFSSWVGFPGDLTAPAETGEATAGAVGTMLDFVGNYRHVPGAMIYGNADELVHTAQSNAMGNEFRARDFPYIFYQHPTGDHFLFALLDEWSKETEYTERFTRVQRPPRVTYRTAEVLGNPDYGLRHDRAYWVSQIRGRETVEDHRDAPDAYIDVDITTFGCGGALPEVELTGSAGVQPVPWVADEHEITGQRVLEQAPRFEATLGNVASLVIDVDEACLADAVDYAVTTDGPSEIRLSDGRVVRLPDAGTHEGPVVATLALDRVKRAGGPERIGTAVEVSRATFDRADTVVLATAEAYPDALTGAPLAAANAGPLLLTGSGALDLRVTAELDRLGTSRVLLLGGEAALSGRVVEALADAGIATERLAGATRFETAAVIARHLGADAADVYVVEGQHDDPARGWPDAVAVSGLAALQQRPVLLTLRDATPAATLEALTDLGTARVTIIGGEAAVSRRAAAALADPGGDGVGTVALHRLAGSTRYETSARVADRALAAGVTTHDVWAATGRSWPDALTAGPAAAAQGGPLLLVDGAAASPAADGWLDANRPVQRLHLAGGTAAISQAMADRLAAILEGG